MTACVDKHSTEMVEACRQANVAIVVASIMDNVDVHKKLNVHAVVTDSPSVAAKLAPSLDILQLNTTVPFQR